MDLLAFNEVVEQFDRTFGSPTDPQALIDLRLDLIKEEASEFDQAINSGDKTKAGKELADLLFVVLGAFDTLGLDLDASLRQVGTKNWAKIQNKEAMKIGPNGKVLKPEGDERFQ